MIFQSTRFRHPGPAATLRLALAFLLLSIPLSTAAQDDPFEHVRKNTEPELRFDESLVEPWRERDTPWPPLPDDAELVRLAVDSAPPGLDVYVAPDSFSLDESDRVSRYWLVLKSDGGGYNAIYQGLRCSVLEYKNYAFGHPARNPPVRESKMEEWRPVSGRGNEGYVKELARDFFCYDRGPRKPVEVRNAFASKEMTHHSPFIP
jgi:hypothetical protein